MKKQVSSFTLPHLLGAGLVIGILLSSTTALNAGTGIMTGLATVLFAGIVVRRVQKN